MQTRLNNAPSLPIGVFYKVEANALESAATIKKALEEAKNFPEDMTYTIPYDSTDFITASIEEVVKTFVEALILVILIIFLFLQNWRATIIPLIAVPVSIVGAFAGMYALGFSINLLTLLVLFLLLVLLLMMLLLLLKISNGHMDMGKTPKRQHLLLERGNWSFNCYYFGTWAVFVPVAFMGGLSGEMYRQFAITIVVSVLISGFVALTLTPSSMCKNIKK